MTLPLLQRATTTAEATHATPFSQAGFCRAWAESFRLHWERLDGRDDIGLVFGASRRLGLRHYQLAPRGLYWGGVGDGAEALAEAAVAHCRRRRTVGITWNFRYDQHDALDAVVRRLGAGACRITEAYTHVLDLGGASPSEILSSPRVAPVTRRQVRQSAERGIMVRPIDGPTSLGAYDAIYRTWAARQGIDPLPAGLVPGLLTALGSQLRMLGAWQGDTLLAAILLFREPKEWFYWHGVRDRDRDRAFATDALLARAIEEAVSAGAARLNFGASAGITSIERFKERWGASRSSVFCLRWDHPRWSRVVSGWRWFRRDRAGA